MKSVKERNEALECDVHRALSFVSLCLRVGL